jgi:repressor LexA
MKRLTDRQREIFNYIKDYIFNKKFPPTIREVADHFHISTKGGYDHIKAIEKKGYIKCNLRRSRAIEILQDLDDHHKKLKKIPVLGNVAAGMPLFAEENFDGIVELPATLIGNGRHFALNIQGDSMIDAGIYNGDIAVIKHQETAENGEIVVAVIDEAVALKRIYIEKNRIKLQSENASYPPIFTQNAKVLGKLACIIRQY